jgi:hypothetical protein
MWSFAASQSFIMQKASCACLYLHHDLACKKNLADESAIFADLITTFLE